MAVRSVLLLIVFIVFSGCTTFAKWAGPTPTPCGAICAQRFEACNQQCTDSCPLCSFVADKAAVEGSVRYKQEKIIMGGYFNRRLKSYRDPLQCRKVTCSCAADLMTCEQNCTGMIHKQLRAVPHCT